MATGRDCAKVVLLSGVNQELVGQRVRLVARVVGTEINSPLIWIEDSGSFALVDVSVMLASDNSTVDLFRQPKCHVMVTGYVEGLEADEVVPARSGVSRLPTSAPLVIRGILIQSVPNIDINMWRDSVIAREKLVERANLLKHAPIALNE